MIDEGTESLGFRARDFALAALTTAYPTEELAGFIASAVPQAHPGLGPMLRRLDDGVGTLQSLYLERFDCGKGRVALYETEYGRMRGLSKGNDLADIVGFYRAFGFELDEGGEVEMPDHIAVQMEFYGILLYKSQLLVAAEDAEGQEIVLDARRKFLISHLGSFVAAIARNPQVVEDPVYGPLLTWCAALVAEECRRTEVNPAPLDFFIVEDNDAAPANCGGCVAIPGMKGSDA